MNKTKERLDKTQSYYKKNYDACLRNQSEAIRKDDYVYLKILLKNRNDRKILRKNPKDRIHKLVPIAKGPEAE